MNKHPNVVKRSHMRRGELTVADSVSDTHGLPPRTSPTLGYLVVGSDCELLFADTDLRLWIRHSTSNLGDLLLQIRPYLAEARGQWTMVVADEVLWCTAVNDPEQESHLVTLNQAAPIEDYNVTSTAAVAWGQYATPMRAVVDSYPFGAIVVFDLNLRYTLVGGEGLKEKGLSAEAMEGFTIWEVFPKAVCEQIEPLYRAALAGEVKLLDVPFNEGVYRTQAGPIRNEKGAIIGGLVITQDVTGQKAAEAAVQSSEAFGRAVLNSLPAQVAVLDAQGTIVRINAAWRQAAIGNENPKLHQSDIGDNYIDACRRVYQEAPEDHATACETVDGLHALREGRLPQFELVYPCHSPTEERWFLLRAVPLQHEGGGMVVSHINITRQKQAEIGLEKREGMLNLAQRIAKMGSYEWYNNGEPAWWSEGMYRLFGFDATQSETYRPYQFPDAAFELIHPNDQERVLTTMAPLEQGLPVEAEYRMRRTDGTYVVVRSIAQPLFDDTDRYIGFTGVLLDVTETRARKDELRLLKLAIEHTDDMILITEAADLAPPGPRIVYVNEAFTRLTGYSVEEAIGRSPRFL